MRISEWMAASGVAFGTSGARGLVSAMTERVCFAYTAGFLQYLAGIGEFGSGRPVALAGDLRPSTPRILRACAAAIRHLGGEVVFCGYVPTPALCNYSYPRGIPSLMVTGSHIPADRNGIKFNRAHGEFLKPDEVAMRAEDVTVPEASFDVNGAMADLRDLPEPADVVSDYVERYRGFFGVDALSGLRLGVYQHSAVGRDVLPQIVAALGAEVVPLGRSDAFVPVDTEAVRAEDVELARAWAPSQRLDALLTTDGDSDRPLLADEHGVWMRGDVLGILASRFLGARSVTTPVSSNTALELSGFAPDMRRTRIGSPFVIEAMADAIRQCLAPVIGYEANGGFLLASEVVKEGRRIAALPTRDAVLPMLCALADARARGTALSGLLATLPPRITASDRLAETPTDVSRAHLARLTGAGGGAEIAALFGRECGSLARIDQTDGVRLVFAGGDIIHLRPSGNAPELRVYVEAGDPARVDRLLRLGMETVRRWKEAVAS